MWSYRSTLRCCTPPMRLKEGMEPNVYFMCGFCYKVDGPGLPDKYMISYNPVANTVPYTEWRRNLLGKLRGLRGRFKWVSLEADADDSADDTVPAPVDDTVLGSYVVTCKSGAVIPPVRVRVSRPASAMSKALGSLGGPARLEDFCALRGHVRVTYAELTRVFGPPDFGPDDVSRDKVLCEWKLEFSHGRSKTLATIYDYREPFTPMDLYTWHVGGYDASSWTQVCTMLEAVLGREVEKYDGTEGLLAMEADAERGTRANLSGRNVRDADSHDEDSDE